MANQHSARSSSLRTLILVVGFPGSGKSTLTSALRDRLGDKTRLIVSSKIRAKHHLGDPFSPEFRRDVQRHLGVAVQQSLHSAETTIVDSNLLEKDARKLVANGSVPALRILVALHAERDVLERRVAAKFGSEYMYPAGAFSGDSVIDHSIATAEPITSTEASELYDAILTLRTDNVSDPQGWMRDRIPTSPVEDSIETICAVAAELAEREPQARRDLRLLGSEDSWMWNPESDGMICKAPHRAITYHRRKKIKEIGDDRQSASALLDYAGSYLGGLRGLAGSRQLIVTSVRLVVLDRGKVLLIRRRDSRTWALVGGSQELDETIREAAARELLEETGLSPRNLDLASVRSDAEEAVVDRFGNINQGVIFTFVCRDYEGDLVLETSETIGAQWFSMDNLPEIARRHRRSLSDAIVVNEGGRPVVG